MPSSVVSSSTASGGSAQRAGRAGGVELGPAAPRSAAAAAVIVGAELGRPAAGRAPRTAVRYTFRRRRAAPPMPMSRPSTTMPAGPAISSRCRATSSSRTAGTADTADTAPVTSAQRIASSTGSPSSVDRRAAGGRCECDAAPSSATCVHRGGVGRGRCRRAAPPRSPPGTSRRCRGSARRVRVASRRATVDLPVPEGPSRANTPVNMCTQRGYGRLSPAAGRAAAPRPRAGTCWRSSARACDRLDVGEQPQHARHRSWHRDLGGAQQRDVGHARAAGPRTPGTPRSDPESR